LNQGASAAQGVSPPPFGEEAGEVSAVGDVRPTIRAIVEDLRAGIPRAEIAARFHETFARMVVDLATRAAQEAGLEHVALSGGTFQNRLLLERCCDLLESRGFRPLYHRHVPPNDGGLALGQALIAAARG